MDMETQWPLIKRTFGSAFRSSFHYAIASVDEAGEPHVTPIGSLLLLEPGMGLYFEKFARQLPQHVQGGGKVCVLAVNSSIWFWLGSLMRGRFPSPPAMRLYGELGVLREATDAEIALWRRRVRKLRHTRGYRLMWQSMNRVREIRFTHMEPVRIGEMTRGLLS
jgi:uncharacterized protein